MYNLNKLDKLISNPNLTFKDEPTTHHTHGIYPYPAKFIPQLANHYIQQYSTPNQVIYDPYMGSGTTLLEALLNNRIAVGADINPLAYLLTKVKTTPIHPNILRKYLYKMQNDIRDYRDDKLTGYNMDIISYWYDPEVQATLGGILQYIKSVQEPNIRDFLLVNFCSILKRASRSYNKGIRPQRDKNVRYNTDLHQLFLKNAFQKAKQIESIYKDIQTTDINKQRFIYKADARTQIIPNESVDLIVTSPPYGISYDHIDIHQLSLAWLQQSFNLDNFRKISIGSHGKNKHKISKQLQLKSEIAQDYLNQHYLYKKLESNSKKKTKKPKSAFLGSISLYFHDLLFSYQSMLKALKPNSHLITVLGNSVIKGIECKNVQVSIQQQENIGLKIITVEKRPIINSMLPRGRTATGQFANQNNVQPNMTYQHDYIIVAKKD